MGPAKGAALGTNFARILAWRNYGVSGLFAVPFHKRRDGRLLLQYEWCPLCGRNRDGHLLT